MELSGVVCLSEKCCLTFIHFYKICSNKGEGGDSEKAGDRFQKREKWYSRDGDILTFIPLYGSRPKNAGFCTSHNSVWLRFSLDSPSRGCTWPSKCHLVPHMITLNSSYKSIDGLSKDHILPFRLYIDQIPINSTYVFTDVIFFFFLAWVIGGWRPTSGRITAIYCVSASFLEVLQKYILISNISAEAPFKTERK